MLGSFGLRNFRPEKDIRGFLFFEVFPMLHLFVSAQCMASLTRQSLSFRLGLHSLFHIESPPSLSLSVHRAGHPLLFSASIVQTCVRSSVHPCLCSSVPMDTFTFMLMQKTDRLSPQTHPDLPQYEPPGTRWIAHPSP